MATIELKTTNGELVDLMNGLFSSQDIKGKDFALTVSNNISTLQGHLAHIEEAGKPTEEFVKFASEIRAAQEAQDTDSVKEMENRNSTLITERKNQLDKVQDMLKKDADPITLEIVKKDSLPNDVTARQVSNLQKIII